MLKLSALKLSDVHCHVMRGSSSLMYHLHTSSLCVHTHTQYVYTDIAYAVMFYYCLYLCLGAKIIMACRDMEKAQEAVKEVIQNSGNENVVCMKLDLADSKSIREFAEAINKGTWLE